ncbi:hypothetical protein NP493_2007g00012 [Ridgeia piscesae]|uniref:Uncharacterized protein n=1 Tax=Ridgeia piscesae TaxID=27915 RepID=A0AAD9JN38_RIDPI|nr:hypothetical protein NP493_2007g00012 [Ridgeia piscesae]
MWPKPDNRVFLLQYDCALHHIDKLANLCQEVNATDSVLQSIEDASSPDWRCTVQGSKRGVCYGTYVESARASNERGQVKTKHVFVAVTCVVVVIVLVGGLLGAAYVFKAAANDIVKFHLKANDKDGQPINEDVESDTTDDVVTYHMMTSMGEQWVVNDFSKRITLYKVSTNGNTACFVSPLNESEADPQTVRANMREVSVTPPRHTATPLPLHGWQVTLPRYTGSK